MCTLPSSNSDQNLNEQVPKRSTSTARVHKPETAHAKRQGIGTSDSSLRGERAWKCSRIAASEQCPRSRSVPSPPVDTERKSLASRRTVQRISDEEKLRLQSRKLRPLGGLGSPTSDIRRGEATALVRLGTALHCASFTKSLHALF